MVVNFIEDEMEEEADEYIAVAISRPFVVSNDCGSTNGGSGGDADTDTNTDTDTETDEIDREEPVEDDTSNNDNNNDNQQPPASSATGMATVVRNARADIADLIRSQSTLAALYLRMIFHDCVGGLCDGCINTSNPENAGLSSAMNSLRDIESKYESQGLSRADIWVLASYVAVEVRLPGGGSSSDPLIPFEHYGRDNCGASDPRQGPDPEMCTPNLGTDQIVNFFAEQFGFSARETAAIMGAHTMYDWFRLCSLHVKCTVF